MYDPSIFKADPVLDAVRYDPGNRSLVLETASQHKYAILHATKALKSDREVVLAAVRHSGDALLLSEFAGDKEVVLEAVANLGDSLRYAEKAFRSDKEIVLAAVRQNGLSLRYACEKLKDDPEVVMVAVRSRGRALRHASNRLRGDLDVVAEALKQDNTAFAYIIAADRETVFGLGLDGHVYQQPLETLTPENQWAVVSKGPVKAFTISGPTIYAILSDGWVYKQTLVLVTPESEWTGPLSGQRQMRSIAVGAGFIYGVSENNGRVYKQVLGPMSPERVWDGPISSPEHDVVFLTINGDDMYALAKDTKMYKQKVRDMSNYSLWEGPLSNTLGIKSVSIYGNKIFAVSTEDKVHWQIWQDFTPFTDWVLASSGSVTSLCTCNNDLKEACTDMLQSTWKDQGEHLARRAAAAMATSMIPAGQELGQTR